MKRDCVISFNFSDAFQDLQLFLFADHATDTYTYWGLQESNLRFSLLLNFYHLRSFRNRNKW